MNRKFSIMTTVNFEKLNNEINEYIKETGNHNPYIFMSEDTAKTIANEFGIDLNMPIYSSVGIKATYTGYQVFINNNLKFGIVEVR